MRRDGDDDGDGGERMIKHTTIYDEKYHFRNAGEEEKDAGLQESHMTTQQGITIQGRRIKRGNTRNHWQEE